MEGELYLLLSDPLLAVRLSGFTCKHLLLDANNRLGQEREVL